jgi:zinc protease
MRSEALRRSISSVLALVVVLGVCAGEATARKPWERLKFPPIGEVKIPDYERHELDNGMVVYLLEDRTWPLVEGQVLVRAGAAFEPADKVGLASITGDVLRTGGTHSIDADALDAELERMGAYIESNIGNTSGSVSFSFLTATASRGLDLVAEVLRQPAFDQEKIDVAIAGERAGVARRNDDLNGIVARELQQAVWGENHPYARDVEYTTLDAITRDDVVAFYEYFYHPDNLMIAVWGDFDAQEMLTQIKARFGDWKRGNVQIPPLPNEPAQPQRRRVLVADKADVNQTRFALGHIGMRADDPDYYAMSVANRILGGGFGDRLFNEVRTNRGLAYNVGSTTGAAFDTPGVFQAYCGTKSSSTDEAIGVVLETIEKMRNEHVMPQELTDAKEGMLASNVFNYVSPQQVLQRKMNLEYLGYPDDFLERYNDSIRAVDADAVVDVMNRRVRPDEFAIVAVGKTADWDGDLTAFGPVEQLDISIPEPEGPEFPEPTDETVEKGRAVLAAARQAHGGNALKNLRSLVAIDAVTISVQGMSIPAEVTNTVVFPDRMVVKFASPMFGESYQAVNTSGGWTKSPQGVVDMSESDAAEMRAQIVSNPLYVLGHFDEFPVQLLEPETVDGVRADVVLVWTDDSAGEWTKMYFDPSTRVLIRTQSRGNNPLTQAPALSETIYEDYGAFGGVQQARSRRTSFDGEEIIAAETKSFEVNAKVDDSVFLKPAS